MTTTEILKKYNLITREANKERALWNLLKANEQYITMYIENDPSCSELHKALRQDDSGLVT